MNIIVLIQRAVVETRTQYLSLTKGMLCQVSYNGDSVYFTLFHAQFL